MFSTLVVAAFRSPKGASARLVDAAFDRKIELAVDMDLFTEWEAVLKRADHAAAINKTTQEIDELLDDLAALVLPVERRFNWRPQLADPDDEMVLEAAVAAAAEAIVTFETTTIPPCGRQIWRVLTPGEVCARLQLWPRR